ncbi:histone deacetylase family protein [Aquisphaera insulae]|uniref:histone deacetylase family protein n=1 Tax=Aquisphaera insulae TaxID=2712864 RepID=UPI0013EB61A7|nr:histone deacetylase [Aquisphaera insulae]
MAVTLYTDRRMINHRVPSHHPERPERLQAILRHLERKGFTETCPSGTVREATVDELLRVHGAAYLREVDALESRGGGSLDPDTWLYAGTPLAARLAAGAAIEAVGHVMKDPDRRALCLVRPPGHHALPDGGMGFCIFSNVALAAMEATTTFDIRRVLIVDFDVHHGNGTQDVFYASERVAFLSIHRFPFYPGTGTRSETGTGPGLGHTVNVPITYGTSRRDYLSAYRAALHDLADRIRPELVLISAGFDAHAEDPVGDLGLDFEDFEIMTEDLVEVAEAHAQGRIVSVLEGGYNVPILAGCVETHLKALGAEPGHP